MHDGPEMKGFTQELDPSSLPVVPAETPDPTTVDVDKIIEATRSDDQLG